MSAPKQNSIAMRVMDHAFAGIVSLWPADSRDWARAMHAEFQLAANAGEKLSWLLGGAMSLTSTWAQRLAFGPRKTREAATPKPVKKPGPLAFALMALAFASLALPGMWPGLETLWMAWSAKVVGASPVQFEKMGREAELKHDAKTLAFAATRLGGTEKSSRHFADAAVAIDPSLTWIYFERPNYNYRLFPSGEDALERARILEKWDPQNAVPYLMEASVTFDRYQDKWSRESSVFRKSSEDRALELANDPSWAAPMAKAFAAPHYDDYLRRNLELNIAVIREHRIDRPTDLITAAWAPGVPNLLAIQIYAAGLLKSGDSLAQSGQFPAARDAYWRVADFGRIMRSAPSVVGRTVTAQIADNLTKRSFEKMAVAANSVDDKESARFANYEIAVIKNHSDLMFASNQSTIKQRQTQTMSIPSLAIHSASASVAISAIVSLVSFGCFLCGLGSWPRVGKYVCRNARIAPIVLVSSIVTFYAVYFPYFSAFRTSSPDSISAAAEPLYAVLSVPMYFASYARGPRYFWTGVIIVGTISVMLLLARMAFRSRMEGAEA